MRHQVLAGKDGLHFDANIPFDLALEIPFDILFEILFKIPFDILFARPFGSLGFHHVTKCLKL